MTTLTYVLLFRGINVGGHNKLPMAGLKEILRDSGFADVQHYIQSGNIVLRSDTRPDSVQISESIANAFGFRPLILVLDANAFSLAVARNPFADDDVDPKTVHLSFAFAPPKLDVAKVETLRAPREQYALINDVFYLFAPDGIGRSRLADKLDACIGVPITTRNLNTVRRLSAMIGDA